VEGDAGAGAHRASSRRDRAGLESTAAPLMRSLHVKSAGFSPGPRPNPRMQPTGRGGPGLRAGAALLLA
jgi:hypothetical protein